MRVGAWCRRLWRVARLAALIGVARRLRPPVRAGTTVVDELPAISVVVPARDETLRIGPLLDAVVGAPGVAEVIVVDDGSCDETAQVGRRRGATVLAGSEPPHGWTGKAWALEQGVHAASGEWVVCLDADARPAPDLATWLVGQAIVRRIDLISASARFDLDRSGRWLHAAMLATLVARFGAPGRAAHGRELINGQCFAFRRMALVGAGGFSEAGSSIVEDVALARSLARRGWAVELVDGHDRLVVEPYRGIGEVWRGWGRSIGVPGEEASLGIALDAAVLGLAMVVPVVRLVGLGPGRADAIDAAAVLLRLTLLAGTATAYRRRGPAFWLSPLADAIAVAAIARSAVRRELVWRGRRIGI